MKIKDIEGREIEITDLPAALEKADMFRGMAYAEQTPEAIAATHERQTYWTDIYLKLLELQSKYNHLK